MNDETFEHIEGATTASETWAILSTNYKGDDKIKRVRLQTLRRQYELLQMETTKIIDVYINKVLALTNQMKSNGETHSEQAKVERILRSLTPGFEHVVAAIEEANDISKMTVRLLSGSLGAHEQRINNNKIEKPTEQTLQAQVVSIGRSYHKHGTYCSKGRGGQNHAGVEQNNIGSNHNPSSNNSWCGERGRRGRGGIYNKSNVECYNCHKRGHYANECRSKRDNHAVNCAQEDSNHEQEEDGVTLEAPVVQPESPAVQTEAPAVQSEAPAVQPEVSTPITTMMERPRRQQRQPVHLQDCEVNLDDEVDDNGDLVHFVFLADSEPVRIAYVIQHSKWKEAMNEELMAIEKKQYMAAHWSFKRTQSNGCEVGVQD